MSSTYFTIPSFAGAKKNKEDLEKSNPQEPVLKDEDEEFLNKQINTDEKASAGETVDAAKIADDGEEKEASPAEQEQVGDVTDQAVVPETQPEVGGADGAQESKEEATKEDEEVEGAKEEGAKEEGAKEKGIKEEDATEEGATEEGAKEEGYDDVIKDKAAEAVKARKAKKSKGMDLPSQEDAEAATQAFNAQPAQAGDAGMGGKERKTWASYLPSVRPSSRKAGEAGSEAEGTATEEGAQRSWTQYASAYVPSSLPSIPSLPFMSKDRDGKLEPVYREDGTIDEEATKERQEKEVSVLLDNLNLSSINNRVFAFCGETQKIYERFALVLKDIINGAPTAYDDMDKLMRDAGPALERQFASMPPFVQTLVKSLPMKLGSTLGPELMAAASEKPGNDMKARMAAASKQPAGTDASAGLGAAAASTDTKEEGAEEGDNKKKGRIPGLKSLVKKNGMVSSMLRNVVTFLQTRFPFLASATNVVMSLAVFILMFVFWYCHKRGKEVRLAKEAGEGGTGEEEDVLEVSDDGDGDADEEDLDEDAKEEVNDVEEEVDADEKKADVLNQPEPTEVPIREKEEKGGEKGAELEGEKSVGV